MLDEDDDEFDDEDDEDEDDDEHFHDDVRHMISHSSTQSDRLSGLRFRQRRPCAKARWPDKRPRRRPPGQCEPRGVQEPVSETCDPGATTKLVWQIHLWRSCGAAQINT